MGRKKIIQNIKAYQKEYGKKWRKEHPERNRKYEERRRAFIYELKKGKKCSHCGYSEHPEILEFHHLRDKSSEMTRIRSIRFMKEEIKKCILLCPNCHRWHHWKEIKSSKEKFKHDIG